MVECTNGGGQLPIIENCTKFAQTILLLVESDNWKLLFVHFSKCVVVHEGGEDQALNTRTHKKG